MKLQFLERLAWALARALSFLTTFVSADNAGWSCVAFGVPVSFPCCPFSQVFVLHCCSQSWNTESTPVSSSLSTCFCCKNLLGCYNKGWALRPCFLPVPGGFWKENLVTVPFCSILTWISPQILWKCSSIRRVWKNLIMDTYHPDSTTTILLYLIGHICPSPNLPAHLPYF